MSTSDKSSIAVILLDYNGKELIERCIRSFVGQTVLPDSLVFVDNGSEVFDEKKIRDAFGKKFENRIDFVRIEKNIGYARAMNRGMQRCLEKNTNWVMTLSNDTELDSCFFENFKKLFPLENSIGMLSPKVRSMHERNKLDATGISLSLDGMSTARGQREVDNGQYDANMDIMMPNGVSGIYRADLLKEVGLLDEGFDAYCEDIDLGLRAWLAGWNCLFIPKSIVYHARSSTYGEYSLNKLYLVERNHYWVAVKNLPLPLVVLNPFFTVYRYLVQVYAILTGAGQGQGFGRHHSIFSLLKTTMRAIAHAALGMPQAIRKRFKIRAMRKRTYLETLLALWRRRMRFHELILK